MNYVKPVPKTTMRNEKIRRNKLSLAKDRLKNKFELQGGLKDVDGS